MSELARLDLDERGRLVVASLIGEVDASNAREVLEDLGGAMPSRAFDLVLDLTRTSYLDSSGVRVLFELARRLKRSQQQLRLVAPPYAPVRRVLDTIAVGTVAPVHGSLPEALEAIEPAPPA